MPVRGADGRDEQTALPGLFRAIPCDRPHRQQPRQRVSALVDRTPQQPGNSHLGAAVTLGKAPWSHPHASVAPGLQRQEQHRQAVGRRGSPSPGREEAGRCGRPASGCPPRAQDRLTKAKQCRQILLRQRGQGIHCLLGACVAQRQQLELQGPGPALSVAGALARRDTGPAHTRKHRVGHVRDAESKPPGQVSRLHGDMRGCGGSFGQEDHGREPDEVAGVGETRIVHERADCGTEHPAHTGRQEQRVPGGVLGQGAVRHHAEWSNEPGWGQEGRGVRRVGVRVVPVLLRHDYANRRTGSYNELQSSRCRKIHIRGRDRLGR